MLKPTKIANNTFAILALLMIWFSPIAQAETVSGAVPFDHNKTGFVLKDVHATLKCEQCHVGGIFKNTPRDCAGCHSIGTRVAAKPKPVNHVVTNKPCETCHISATTFQVASYSHIGVTGGCVNCHNGQSRGVMSKPANHFPTLAPCENCHTSTVTFTSWKMDHTGITTGCASCHGGQFAGVVSQPPMPTQHVQTNGAPCESCHSNTTTFLGAGFNHTGVAPGSCMTCHNGTMPGALGQPTSHIPTLGVTACDTCHVNTAGFTTWANGIYDHITPSPAGKCAMCHNGSYTGSLAQGMNPGHVATLGASCDTCHTSSNTANYTTFLGAGYDHSAVVLHSCANGGCHDGTSTAGALGISSFPTHISIVGSLGCDDCHTATVTQNYTTFLGALYDHTKISPSPAGRCSTCHNGTSATGKTVGHVVTSAQCDTCHKTQWGVSWLGALYHANTPVSANSCGNAGCHDGSPNGVAAGAQGKTPTHIATTGPACDSCHTNTLGYSTWLGAIYSHTGVVAGTCATCHDNLHATGKPALHIPATGSCDSAGCHSASNTATYTVWSGATFGHVGVASGSCATCHNGSYPGVTSQTSFPPFVHQVTSAPCDQCHTQSNTSNYTTWLGAGYAHSSADAGKCAGSSCHGPGGSGKGVTANHVPIGANSCDASGCHAIPGAMSFIGGNLVHSLFAASRCDSCHNGSYTTFGNTGAIVKVSNHIPTTIVGTADCNTCHSLGSPPNTAAAAAGGASLWGTSEKMNHNSAQGGGVPVYCVTCHLSGVTYLGKMQKMSHNGASTAKDCSSSSCHKPLGKTGTTYSSWGG